MNKKSGAGSAQMQVTARLGGSSGWLMQPPGWIDILIPRCARQAYIPRPRFTDQSSCDSFPSLHIAVDFPGITITRPIEPSYCNSQISPSIPTLVTPSANPPCWIAPFFKPTPPKQQHSQWLPPHPGPSKTSMESGPWYAHTQSEAGTQHARNSSRRPPSPQPPKG